MPKSPAPVAMETLKLIALDEDDLSVVSSLLQDAVLRSAAPSDVVVVDKLFRRDPIALAMPRGDADFRLAVDRALSRLFRSKDLLAIYEKHFGAPSSGALEFFQTVALPD